MFRLVCVHVSACVHVCACVSVCVCNSVTEKQIDLKTVDLKKLRVRDLKKILNDWDEDCRGCAEKSDFIARIEQLKSKHTEL